jgi:mono/diheme cytochrome c family protein
MGPAVVAAALMVPLSARGADAEKVDFSRDVLPILSANCFVCHGRDPSTRKARLRLDIREGATAASAGSDPAIVPGKPDASEVLVRISAKDEGERMPPADKGRALSPAEIETLRAWIAQGAEYTGHWAFAPPRRAAPPRVRNSTWARTPIDRFVLARLQQADLAPAPRASREVLLRRATLDLLGLPPTPAQIAAFVADRSPAAYAKLVDRLLASPHHGERWGRHWLDVARYADSGGFETDIFFGHAWRYRDYVIRSFNADKPFNRFIKEQIAGDELYPRDKGARVATGLYTTGPVLQEAGMVTGKLEYDQNTDFVDTTGSAFLGLTLGCARCHDHKYDPVSQKEYFSLQAIFAASDQVDFAADGTKIRDRAALKRTDREFEAEQARTRARREKNPARRAALLAQAGDAYIEADPELKRQVDAGKRYDVIAKAVRQYRAAAGGETVDLNKQDPLDIDPEDGNDQIALKAALLSLRNELRDRPADAALVNVGAVALLNPPPRQPRDRQGPAAGAPARPAAAPASRPPGGRRAFNALKTEQEKREFLLALGRQQLTIEKPEGYVEDLDALRRRIGEKHLDDASPIPHRVLAHRDTPSETRLLKRGELETPGEVVEPGLPEALSGGRQMEGTPPTRRRAALAEWIAANENLLTARVIVNRVWQWHFGEGLVRTPNDFGIRGERPTHPELLDWLAVDFMAHGWRLKRLHRLIMNSAAYQMAGTADEKTLERDPDNRLLTRYQPHRLQAEVIWDSVRAVAGSLDLAMFGLPIAPPLDEQEQLGNYRKWPTSTPEEANRRALYILVKRSFRFPMLSAFDLPDNITSCGRRDITTVPNQALTLLNNRTIREQASAFADRLLSEAKGDLQAVPARAWLRAYGRPISTEEHAQALAFLRERSANGDAKPAVTELCMAIFNTTEFMYQQ